MVRRFQKGLQGKFFYSAILIHHWWSRRDENPVGRKAANTRVCVSQFNELILPIDRRGKTVKLIINEKREGICLLCCRLCIIIHIHIYIIYMCAYMYICIYVYIQINTFYIFGYLHIYT